MNDELREHPAVRAWRRARPDASPPVRVERLSKERVNGAAAKRRTGVFRLYNGPDVAPTIAKRRLRESLEAEHVIYQQVLPELPIPPVRCLGFVGDQDPERAWLFLEDIGGERYEKDRYDHQVVAARWLATLHTFGMNRSTRALLPDRGPNHYLGELRCSCTEISSHVGRGRFNAHDRRILIAILRALSALERRWDKVEAWCDSMPHTLVHGDFVAKNCRVRKPSTGDLELFAFDWETAGWGVPAVDLASNAFTVHGIALDRARYAEEIGDAWPGLGKLDLERAARIGDVQRVIAAIRWACAYLMYPWIVQAEMRFYLPSVEQAVRLVGDNEVRRPRGRPAATKAVGELA
jgi:hypothetical protein